jgi:signal transduction histidine kinase
LRSDGIGADGENDIFIEVEDSGPGIDPDRLNSIFDAFVTTKERGTGLGLAICRTIIEDHGGELLAFSDGRNGTLLRIVLPIVPVEKPTQERSDAIGRL